MPRFDDDRTESVRTVKKRLRDRGSGVSLEFGSSFATAYNLDPETEVEVTVVETDGDVSFEISDIPAGFDYEQLVGFAADHGWTKTDEYVDENRNEWFLTYRTDSGSVAVEVDSESHIDNNVVNNVTIRGDPVDVTHDYSRYANMCAAAQRVGATVDLTDSGGVWERLRSRPGNSGDAGPDPETFDQLSEAAEVVTASLVYSCSSLHTSLETIGRVAKRLDDEYPRFDE
ncbi:hypothetical protein RYH80_00165 [Halobaculum sp. MBLA0147]|uniref:hypothetical protein n=1 Tax=Halobaculum sp. MBLA0147 TaxID=3079934 RepID=UPI0035268E62